MIGSVIIDFETFLIMVAGIFGLVGFVRGWWKEAITTGLLILLLFLLRQPTIAGSIIEQINKILRIIAALFTARSLELTEIAAAAGTVEAPSVDPGAFQPYIIVLIILIVASYFVGNAALNGAVLTPIARLFGGILGLINGFIILSLLREYILRRFLPESGVSAAAAVPDTITVTVSNVPEASIMDGLTFWAVLIGGLLVVILALGTRFKYTSGKVVRQTPLGYRPTK